MDRERWFAGWLFFPLFILGMFLVGWHIPTFYDWSAADQSRSTPEVGFTAWGILGASILCWAVIPWLPMPAANRESEKRKPFQFNLRMLLVITAISIAGMINLPIIFFVVAAFAIFVTLTRIIFSRLEWPRKIAVLLACMYFPYAWVFTENDFGDLSLTLFFGAIGLPAFIPAMLVGRILGQHPQNAIWLFLLMTAAEFAIGCWMVKLGPKRSMGYLVLIVMMSIFGSFGLNALIRM